MEYASEYDEDDEKEEIKEDKDSTDLDEESKEEKEKEKEKEPPEKEEAVEEETPFIAEKDEYTVIIDIGQATTKVGFAGDTKPKTFPTVIGKPKYQQRMAGVEAQDIYVGNDTINMRGVLKLEYPINRGQVMDWNHYYALLNHIFYNVLRIDPKKCNIIYIVPPLTPPDSSHYFARVLFETHQCKSVVIIDSATTSVFSVGETTGLCVELGEGLTTITPVMDGQLYPPSIQRLNLAGVDILNYLQSLLSRYGIVYKREILNDIKEESCKIALEPEKAADNSENDEKFILPDGESLEINAYVSTWTGEVLFQPTLLGYNNMANLPQAIINSISNTHQAYWWPLLHNIIFSGGTSKFRGLDQRLEKELENMVSQLGPIQKPEPQEEPDQIMPKEEELKEKKKMVQVKTSIKGNQNCPKCGELLEGENKFCPHCGAELEMEQIEIIGAAQQNFPTKCPKCEEELDGDSPFCPFCGAKLEPILEEKEKLKWKERRRVKKAKAEDKELGKIMEEVSSEYAGVEEMDEEEKEKEEEEEDDDKMIRIIQSDAQAYASFKGAAILGSLPSFKQYMATHDQYKDDPNSVLVDFSQILQHL